MTAWPPGELRLEGTQPTTDAQSADVFIVPCALTQHFPNRDSLYRLPHFKGNEAKHVLLDVTDNQPLYGLPTLFIRCNTRTWYLPQDPNTISWPWPVEDFSECIDMPHDGFKYDVSFQGWLSSRVRELSSNACKSHPRLKCDIAQYNDFYGYRKPEDPEFMRRRLEFRRSMRESRVALCPESIAGVFPYRFFEAMSAARVPVLVGSDFVFPFADEIPYQDFILHISRQNAATTGHVIRFYLATTTDDELKRRGLIAREYWLRFLNRDDWPKTMTYAVEKALRPVQC